MQAQSDDGVEARTVTEVVHTGHQSSRFARLSPYAGMNSLARFAQGIQ